MFVAWLAVQVTLFAAGAAVRVGRGGPPAASAGLFRGLLLFAVVSPAFVLLVPPLQLHLVHVDVGLGGPVAGAGASTPLRSASAWWPLVAVVPFGLAALRAFAAVRGATVRRLGAVRIVVSAHARVPFALVTPGRAWVVVDVATWASPHRAVAVAHELAHHRRRDPAWAWLELALAALAPPAALLWRPVLVESIELATDAATARRHPPRAVAAALVDVAAGLAPSALARAFHHPALLRRRVQMLLTPRSSPLRLVLAGVVGLPLTAAVGLAADLPAPTDPNPDVAAALDHLTGTAAGRSFVARGLAGRAVYGARVDAALAAAGLPAGLAGIPLVESGYANFATDDVDHDSSLAPGPVGAGVWMFIPATARTYGLRVDHAVDERLDFDKETAAAVALLTDLHAHYGDWSLAIAGYNLGDAAVDRAVATGGTHDAWALVRAGLLNDYLPLVVAADDLLGVPRP